MSSKDSAAGSSIRSEKIKVDPEPLIRVPESRGLPGVSGDKPEAASAYYNTTTAKPKNSSYKSRQITSIEKLKKELIRSGGSSSKSN